MTQINWTTRCTAHFFNLNLCYLSTLFFSTLFHLASSSLRVKTHSLQSAHLSERTQTSELSLSSSEEESGRSVWPVRDRASEEHQTSRVTAAKSCRHPRLKCCAASGSEGNTPARLFLRWIQTQCCLLFWHINVMMCIFAFRQFVVNILSLVDRRQLSRFVWAESIFCSSSRPAR